MTHPLCRIKALQTKAFLWQMAYFRPLGHHVILAALYDKKVTLFKIWINWPHKNALCQPFVWPIFIPCGKI
jgi:hypothetical protein